MTTCCLARAKAQTLPRQGNQHGGTACHQSGGRNTDARQSQDSATDTAQIAVRGIYPFPGRAKTGSRKNKNKKYNRVSAKTPIRQPPNERPAHLLPYLLLSNVPPPPLRRTRHSRFQPPRPVSAFHVRRQLRLLWRLGLLWPQSLLQALISRQCRLQRRCCCLIRGRQVRQGAPHQAPRALSPLPPTIDEHGSEPNHDDDHGHHDADHDLVLRVEGVVVVVNIGVWNRRGVVAEAEEGRRGGRRGRCGDAANHLCGDDVGERGALLIRCGIEFGGLACRCGEGVDVLTDELAGATGDGRQCHSAIVDGLSDDCHTVLRDDAGPGAAGGVDFRGGERRAGRAGEGGVKVLTPRCAVGSCCPWPWTDPPADKIWGLGCRRP
ncbi:hypothetical protein B0T18DRAFT_410016 [Schizothecium vesticola]|uniref:Uncharacterized protein n=1 Tax=Schizothecium vesticola TaxID=314040 RepID=A0AA40K4K9_9PEZI|nr:hypothetical protein B0T18DRAFT_410016 [Schizothecium vesticola]